MAKLMANKAVKLSTLHDMAMTCDIYIQCCSLKGHMTIHNIQVCWVNLKTAIHRRLTASCMRLK